MADRSIKLRLEAEVSQYKNSLDAAAKATEQMAAKAELAAKNVDVAALKQKESAVKVASAEKALKEARNSGKASAEQLIAAERRVVEAKRNDFKASQDLKSAEQQLAQAKDATAKASTAASTRMGKFNAFLSQNADDVQTAASGMAVFGGAITAVGLAAAKTGIDYNTLQQSSRAALTTLLGSAEAANEQMDKLDAFAKTSPFAKQTFITAQQQMLAFGIEAKKVVPYMQAINDAVAAAGGSSQDFGEIAFVLSQIQAAGKLTATDLMQLGQRGVNAAELIGSQMGKTGAQIKKEITAGTLDAGVALDALTAGMQEKFAGASANVKNTMVGASDRIKAAWRDLSSELAEGLVGKDGGGFLVDLANSTADAMRGFQKLPGPAKASMAAIVLLTGATAAAGGAALLAAPRFAAFNAAILSLSASSPGAARAVSAVGKAGKVAALALPAIAAVGAAISYDGGSTSQGLNEIRAGLADIGKGAKSTDTMFKNVQDGNWFVGGRENLRDLVGVLTDDSALVKFGNGLADFSSGLVKTLTFGAADVRGSIQIQRDELRAYGAELANMAETDLPTVVNAFSALNAEAGGYMGAELLETMPELRDGLIGVAKSAGLATDDATLLKIATGELAVKVDEAGSVVKDAAPSYEEWAKALQLAADSADKAFSSLTKLSDVFLSQRAAERDFVAAGKDIAKSIEEVQKKYTDAELKKGKALDISTEAGQKNQAALDAYTKKALDTVEASYAAGDSQDEVVAKMERAREAVLKAADGYGMSTKEAEAYVDAAHLVPEEVRSTFMFDTSKAEGRAEALKAYIEGAGQSVSDWTINADGTQAINAADGTVIQINKKTGEVTISGNGGPALVDAVNTVNAINRKNATVNVNAGTGNMWSQVLAAPLPNRTVYVDVVRRNGGGEFATGGRVTLPAFAGGGRLPRTGLGTDQILGVDAYGRPTARVDDREWVINRRSSDKYNGLLGKINRDDPSIQGLAGLATGGRVGTKTNEYNKAKSNVSSWSRTVKAWEKSVKDAEKAYQNASGKSAKKAAKARLNSAKADLKRAQSKLKAYEKERDRLKKELADLKATRADLTSGVNEKSFTYDEKTGTVKTSNSLMDQGTSGLSGAYNLVDQVKAASKLAGLSKSQQEAMAKAAKSAKAQFEKLYKEAALLEGKLGKAKEHVSEMASVSNSVKSGLAGGFSLGDSITEEEFVGGLRTQKRGVTGADLVANGQKYAEKLRTFGKALKKLADWGLSSTVLQEIAGYGVDEGLMIAESISQDQVKQLNGVYKDIDMYSAQAGQHATRNFTTEDGTFIAGGLAAGEKTVATLEKQIAANEKALATQTDKLLDAWGKPFSIKYDAKTGKMVSITPAKKKDGGWITGPGTGTSDEVPIWASNGEFMVKAREAQKPANAALLRAMNAGKSINPPASYAGIDYNRLGAAVASAIAANPQRIVSNLVMDRRTLATWMGMATQAAKQLGVSV